MKSAFLGALGIGLFLALWEVIGQTKLLGISWPPLSDVLELLADGSRRPLFERALGATLESTALGYLWGTGAGLVLATVAHLLPVLRRGSDRLAAVLDSVLRLAWPAALIGAIIGEWFGAPRGIGILIINAMQNFQIVLLWSAVLLAVGTSLVVYGLLTLLERAAYARFG